MVRRDGVQRRCPSGAACDCCCCSSSAGSWCGLLRASGAVAASVPRACAIAAGRRPHIADSGTRSSDPSTGEARRVRSPESGRSYSHLGDSAHGSSSDPPPRIATAGVLQIVHAERLFGEHRRLDRDFALVHSRLFLFQNRSWEVNGKDRRGSVTRLGARPRSSSGFRRNSGLRGGRRNHTRAILLRSVHPPLFRFVQQELVAKCHERIRTDPSAIRLSKNSLMRRNSCAVELPRPHRSTARTKRTRRS